MMRSFLGRFFVNPTKSRGSLTSSAMAPVATWVGMVGGVPMPFTVTFWAPIEYD
jgi:hypothetical protein